MTADAAWNEFIPPNSFRWRWLDWHGTSAIHVIRRKHKSDNFVFSVSQQNATALENVRKKCVEMDENARRNGALV